LTTAQRDYLAALGAQLHAARTNAGITQGEVAARAGVSRQLVARIEAGHPTGEVAAVGIVKLFTLVWCCQDWSLWR
jgi:transcriptional regulator with XRE-family HTH domain